MCTRRPIPTLSPQLPALSTLSKAKGGNKVAEALTGHVTLRFLQLQRRPRPARVWLAECRKEVR